MNTANMTYRERLALLRAEQIRGNFLVHGHTTFSQHCLEYWTGFHWHSHKNSGRPHGFGELQDATRLAGRVS